MNGQGGLLDITLHPDYANNGWLYISYSSPEGEGNTTRGQHYGGRLQFDNDGYLFFSIGERGDHFNTVQDMSMDGGKIYRINEDGSIPADNPFVGTANAKTAIWSYGHRNPQGMDIHPLTGELWAAEAGRIRNVRQGPDGYIYLGVEGGYQALNPCRIKLPDRFDGSKLQI